VKYQNYFSTVVFVEYVFAFHIRLHWYRLTSRKLRFELLEFVGLQSGILKCALLHAGYSVNQCVG